MINQVFSTDACSGSGLLLPAAGKCCNISTGFVKGTGVANCVADTAATAGSATDTLALNCLQGYGFVSGVCTVCTAGNTAAATGTAVCAACAVNFFCASGTASTSAIAPVACPTDSTSAVSAKVITDCTCTTATKVIDTTTNACVATYTGGLNCLTFASGTAVDTCTLCKTGFRIAAKVCLACSTGCATCDSTGTVPAAGAE
jgi:hypothetical protein